MFPLLYGLGDPFFHLVWAFLFPGINFTFIPDGQQMNIMQKQHKPHRQEDLNDFKNHI